MLATRGVGGARVSRPFYPRGQTGQNWLRGAYQGRERRVEGGMVQMSPRHEMLELVVVDGRARGIVVRDGALTTRLALVFATDKGVARSVALSGTARIDRLAVARADGSALASAAAVDIALSRVTAGQIRSARIVLRAVAQALGADAAD